MDSIFSAAAVSIMGVSVSLLTATAAVIAGAAGCFAAGYIIALNSISSPIASSDDDDKDPQSKSTLRRRLIRWAPAMLFGRPKGRGPSPEEAANDVKQKKKKKHALEIENLAEILEDFKMVLVVRNDLKMGKGKIAAQCSHATLGLYKKLHNRAPKALSRWEMCGQVKVVLKIESEEDMLILQERAKSLMLPTHVTIDAGRTQIAPNSRTVMAILARCETCNSLLSGSMFLYRRGCPNASNKARCETRNSLQSDSMFLYRCGCPNASNKAS